MLAAAKAEAEAIDCLKKLRLFDSICFVFLSFIDSYLKFIQTLV
jgi:hypothetical protein